MRKRSKPTQSMTCEQAQTVLLLGSAEDNAQAQLHQKTCSRCGPQTLSNVQLPSISRWLVALLTVTVVVQIALAAQWMFGRNPFHLLAMDPAHATRDGALGLAIASAGLLVLYRHRYAQPGFLFGAAVLVLQAVASVFDTAERRITAEEETAHLLSLFLVILLGVAATHMKFRSLPKTAQPAKPSRHLHAVQNDS